MNSFKDNVYYESKVNFKNANFSVEIIFTTGEFWIF